MAVKRIVSKRLKGLMVEHELTCKDLSKKLGIHDITLNLKINGKRPWYFMEVALIAKVFGYTDIKDVFPELYDSVLRAS